MLVSNSVNNVSLPSYHDYPVYSIGKSPGNRTLYLAGNQPQDRMHNCGLGVIASE